jgi:hypothetical protein
MVCPEDERFRNQDTGFGIQGSGDPLGDEYFFHGLSPHGPSGIEANRLGKLFFPEP